MDGVVWKSDAPIGDLPKTFARIRERGLKFVFAPTTGQRPGRISAKKLSSLGVESGFPLRLVTSALASPTCSNKNIRVGLKSFMIGGPGVREALEEKGFELLSVENAPKRKPFVMALTAPFPSTRLPRPPLLVTFWRPVLCNKHRPHLPHPARRNSWAGSWLSVVTMATGIQPIVAGQTVPNHDGVFTGAVGYEQKRDPHCWR